MTRLFRMNANDFKELKQKYKTNSNTIKITDADIEFLIIAEEKEMPTKHIMTRAEAIALLKKHTPMVENAAKIIDFYIAAGMLEVKEEETSIDAIMLRDVDGDLQQIKMLEIAKVLDKNGFELKKKS